MQIKQHTLNLLGLNPTGDLGHLTAYTSRRHGTVWFPKSPPLTPPTLWQLRQRDRFRHVAYLWSKLDDQTRELWALAARLANLYVTGYNLFTWYQCTRDRAALSTIERQSGQELEKGA